MEQFVLEQWTMSNGGGGLPCQGRQLNPSTMWLLYSTRVPVTWATFCSSLNKSRFPLLVLHGSAHVLLPWILGWDDCNRREAKTKNGCTESLWGIQGSGRQQQRETLSWIMLPLAKGTGNLAQTGVGVGCHGCCLLWCSRCRMWYRRHQTWRRPMLSPLGMMALIFTDTSK